MTQQQTQNFPVPFSVLLPVTLASSAIGCLFRSLFLPIQKDIGRSCRYFRNVHSNVEPGYGAIEGCTE